jgi:hypothetical protein
MTKFVAIFALTAGLAGCAGSPFNQAPAARVAPSSAASPYAQPGIPQSQFECVTDDGYGRFQPCGSRS